MITGDLLRAVMPHCPQCEVWAGALEQCRDEAFATTIPRAAALLAQLAHESGECRWLVEVSDGSQYEGRRDLGNLAPGDGARFKGRGLLQLTGRANYREAGRALGLELELNPDEAARPIIAGRVAAWYWRDHGCNELADGYQFSAITRRINGGLNGLAQRQAYYLRALEEFGKEMQ